MGLAIVAGAIAAAFLNLDRIEHFKGAGFEAEMKRVVEKAYATIENLKDLARPLILSTLDILTSSGRWGGMDLHQKHELAKGLERVARSLTLHDKDLESARETFYRYHVWDHYTEFTNAVSKEKDVDDSVKNRLAALRNYESLDYPSKELIVRTLGYAAEAVSPETKETLADYLYYLKERHLRRNASLPR
ncbi:MAG: hypothetical protein ACM3ZO_10400 [Clostridia bacterium]